MTWKSYARKRNINVHQGYFFPGGLKESSGKVM
jgi:hypothetical protein